MADNDIREEIVTDFFLNTCQIPRQVNDYDSVGWRVAAVRQSLLRETGHEGIPLIAGSVAEFYIEPMLSCVGDVDVMLYLTNLLAIPAGYPPPTQLPPEFDGRVEVWEIVDSGFPGYVYFESSCVLTESVDDDKYNAVRCERKSVVFPDPALREQMHGPALVYATGPCFIENHQRSGVLSV